MFGYIVPDKMNMYIKDFTLFRAYYCGLCKTLGRTGMPHTRLCTNYDTTFLSVLAHSLKGQDVKIKNAPCILNPLKRRSFVAADDISYKVADITVLLGYYKLSDDVIDGQKGRALLKPWLYSRMRRAKKRCPEVWNSIKQGYGELRKLEKEKCDSIDKAADPFGKIIESIVCYLVPDADENTKVFAYELGKLVYLFDAVDDVWKDCKKKRYNPFIAKYGKPASKEAFLKEHLQDVEFLLKTSYNTLVEAYDKMNIVVSEGVLSNIVYLGIDMQIKRLLKGEDKCITTRL